jgi:hypothetical protein
VSLMLVLVVGLVVFLTFGPMFDSSRRGENTWTWVVAGLLLGPLSGVAYYTARRGVRLAQRREASFGRHRRVAMTH